MSLNFDKSITDAEYRMILEKRAHKGVQLSDEERNEIARARQPRQPTLDDLDPENWAKLSTEERVRVRDAVREAVVKAVQGE